MKIIRNENTIYCDVDNTLIFHIDKNNPVPGPKVEVYDTLRQKSILMIANEPMIRILQEEKHKGAYVTVWSRGGFEWASNVVKALNLEHSVDQVMTKPLAYMDDLDISEWLKYRVYLPPQTVYKK